MWFTNIHSVSCMYIVYTVAPRGDSFLNQTVAKERTAVDIGQCRLYFIKYVKLSGWWESFTV